MFRGEVAVSFSNSNVSHFLKGQTLIKQTGRWQYSQIHHANGSLGPPKKSDAKFLADFCFLDPEVKWILTSAETSHRDLSHVNVHILLANPQLLHPPFFSSRQCKSCLAMPSCSNGDNASPPRLPNPLKYQTRIFF